MYFNDPIILILSKKKISIEDTAIICLNDSINIMILKNTYKPQKYLSQQKNIFR